MSERLILAGQSKPRLEALEQISNVQVRSVEGGEELNDFGPLSVAIGKMITVLLKQKNKDRLLGGEKLIAADVMTALPDENNQLVACGKVSGPAEILEEFSRMIKNKVDFYHIIAGSVVVDSKAKEVSKISQIKVSFRRAMLAYLATDVGFKEYLSLGKEILGSSDGNWISHISGGILLEALLKMGAVQTINNLELNNLSYDERFKTVREAFYLARIGFAPEVLECISPYAYEEILAWEWLNEQVENNLASSYR